MWISTPSWHKAIRSSKSVHESVSVHQDEIRGLAKEWGENSAAAPSMGAETSPPIKYIV